MDNQEDEEVFDNLINDIQHHHNDDNNSDYLTDDSDGYDNSLESWEAEYYAMDKEEVMILIDYDIAKEGYISDHEYGSNKSEEEKIGRESEVEEGFDDYGDEEGGDVEEEEKKLHEGP